MENFFNYFKQKLSLDDEQLYKLRNIILSDNKTFVKDTFNNFIENKQHIMNDNNFFYCCLFLYCLDIHREFKKKLLSIISLKLNIYQDIKKYITNFLSYIDLSLLSSTNINELKFKFLLLNNLYDVSMKYLNINKNEKTDKNDKNKNKEKNEDKNKERDIIKNDLLNIFFNYFIISFEKKEFSILIKDSNDEIGLILNFYINCFLNIINNIYSNLNYDFNNIFNIIENDLISMPLDYSIKTKDLLFIYSNLYFYLFLKLNNNDEALLKTKADTFLEKCLNNLKSFEIIFSYIKGLFNNFNYNININYFIYEKLNIFNKFIDEKIILLHNEKELKHNLSMGEFYLYFLEHDINGKYSLIINDIIVLILGKIISAKNEKTKNDLITWVNESKIIDLITKKIEKEKNNFNFIEDNFFDILLALFNKTNSELKQYISIKINEYLINIINSKKKFL